MKVQTNDENTYKNVDVQNPLPSDGDSVNAKDLDLGSSSIGTFTGDIETNFGPGAERTSKYMPGEELRFTEGSGSAQVRLETLNGSIEILRAE